MTHMFFKDCWWILRSTLEISFYPRYESPALHFKQLIYEVQNKNDPGNGPSTIVFNSSSKHNMYITFTVYTSHIFLILFIFLH